MAENPPQEPIPSFDIDSEEFSDFDEQPDIFALSEATFAEDEIDFMIYTLKERGLFYFIKLFVDEKGIEVSKLLLIFGVQLPAGVISKPDQLRVLKIACSRVLRNREKLEEYNTVDDAVELIRNSKRILILTGAGVSTSCGIPDFRSKDGLYARLKDENWPIDDPQEMFDLTFFKERPDVFYAFAKEIYPSNFVPSPCHRFVRLLELNGQLLRNYTQNIDGLFEQVGVEKILNCHGSFATASCIICKSKFPGSAIEQDVFAQRVPLCSVCVAAERLKPIVISPAKVIPAKWKESGRDASEDEDEAPSIWKNKPIVKPDIVFFGEMLSDDFDKKLLLDREEVDLLITIGTSLRVSPVAQIVAHLPHSIPQILINKDPITHANFDIHLLGDGDIIIKYLCEKLGENWNLEKVPSLNPTSSIPIPLLPPTIDVLPNSLSSILNEELPKSKEISSQEIVPERVGNDESPVWLFPGSDGSHPWLQAVRRAYSDEEEIETSVTVEIEASTSRGRSEEENREDDLNKKARIL